MSHLNGESLTSSVGSRARLIRFYQRYNPSKLADLDIILESFQGSEEAMFAALVERYGPEPRDEEQTEWDWQRPTTNNGGIQSVPTARDASPASITTTKTDDIRKMLSGGVSSVSPKRTVSFLPQGQHLADESKSSGTLTLTPQMTRSRATALQVNDRRDADAAVAQAQRNAHQTLRSSFEKLQKIAVELCSFDVSAAAAHYGEAMHQLHSEDKSSLEFLQLMSQLQSLSASFVEEASLLLAAHDSEAKKKPPPIVEPSPSTTSQPQANIADDVTPQRTSRDRARRESPTQRNVVNVLPVEGTTPTPVIQRTLDLALGDDAGDVAGAQVTLVLHPGTYYENLSLPKGILFEMRPSFVGASVEIVPLSPSKPSLYVGAGTKCQVHGVHFVGDKLGFEALAPLVVATSGSDSLLQNCYFHQCAGGGVTAQGEMTNLQVIHCSFQDATFAALYAKSGAFVCARECNFLHCEVGLRVRDGSFSIIESNIKGSTSDGVACHGAVEGAMEDTTITLSGESGALLSPSAAVTFTNCVVTDNSRYAIYAPSGAEYVVSRCNLKGNAIAEYNRPPLTALRPQWSAVSR